MKIKANLTSGKVSSNSSEAFNLLSTSKFGERTNEKVVYSLFEALFLVNQNKMTISNSKEKEMNKEEVEKKFGLTDKNFKIKYCVFNDLRGKGYILKSALKFGADFRVYEKGKSIGGDHSKWLLFCTEDKTKLSWNDFAAKNRIAHSTKKNLLVAVVDDEEKITYFETKWLRIQ